MKKIIILGSGQVGTSVAEILSKEENDITVVDHNPAILGDLHNRIDVRTVVGDAASPDVLRQAGAEDAELVLAVTDSDEVNIVACQVSTQLFNTPTRIARIRSASYLSHPELFERDIDHIISPEQILTQQITKLIEYPGALQVLDFAGGRIRLVGIRAYYGGALVGHAIKELKRHLPRVTSRIAAIYRRDRAITPTGKTVIEADDEVFFIATREDIGLMMQELRKTESVGRDVFIAGAGNIGYTLASALEQTGYQVKLVERNLERAKWVSERLDNTIVLHGDAADEALLRQENIDAMQLFCALTNEDEANILAALLAKRLGAKRVMSLINKTMYIELVESMLDIAISPRLSTVSELLSHVRRGDVVAAHSLRRGVAEAIEAVAHGDRKTSKLVGRRVGDLSLPEGAALGAVMRNERMVEIDDEAVIEDGDHVIMFMVDKARIPDVERLFEVSATFF
ncbi:MAG: Trk system potassium transporter TrkA [Gammaproteobacteria bacterium]|nr:Trk system potassium transporter TrkA [Gammaproteobacteria bacterium]MYD77144.1 Trk system potassium transporter TrkA [Gammaproteobacteria bacterium]MYJ52894.1 Trk system potassium transporter TrkA [Gammaproteobacteria bacterium]